MIIVSKANTIFLAASSNSSISSDELSHITCGQKRVEDTDTSKSPRNKRFKRITRLSRK